MGNKSIISLDAMSGDLGAEVVVRAAAATRHPVLQILRGEAPARTAPVVIEDDVGNPQDLCLRRTLFGATQDGANAGHQFAHAERFGHIVVGAYRQPIALTRLLAIPATSIAPA